MIILKYSVEKSVNVSKIIILRLERKKWVTCKCCIISNSFLKPRQRLCEGRLELDCLTPI